LNAAEKGFRKLSNALGTVKKLEHTGGSDNAELRDDLLKMVDACYSNMSDDFNTAKTLAALFEMSARINDFKSGNLSLKNISEETFHAFRNAYIQIMEDVLGLREEEEHNHELLSGVINVLIDLRKKARVDKNYALSDKIRDDLKQLGVQLKDGKDGEINFTIE
jgi:cysteinyl-tRNA synthetase